MTKSVVKPSVVCAAWSVRPVVPVVLLMLLLLKLLLPLGSPNDERIASYCSASAKHSGRQKSTPNVRRHAGCGSQSTRSWAVDTHHYQHRSTPATFINSSTKKSPACALLQPTHRRRRSLLRLLAASCRHLSL